MIDITATLLVQIAFFYCSYLLLRYLLLEPVLAIMHDHEHAQHELLQEIGKHKETIKKKEQEKKHIWTLCQRFFTNHIPVLKPRAKHTLGETIQPIQLPHINNAELERQAINLEHIILGHLKTDDSNEGIS